MSRSILVVFCIVSPQIDSSTLQDPPSHSAKSTAVGEIPEWATLVGSTERNKYHRPSCRVAKRIKPANAIWFRDADDATENGYVAAACKDSNCRPPQPATLEKVGEIGGALLPPPDPNPPEIPPVPKPSRPKAKSATGNAKNVTLKKPLPPPRMKTSHVTTPAQTWQGISPIMELDARRRWDVWATWAVERWCERWHVSPSGTIKSDSAYSPKTEQLLIGKLKRMKEQMDDNKKRMNELKDLLEGKKKPVKK